VGGWIDAPVEAEEKVGAGKHGWGDDLFVQVDEEMRVGKPEGIVADDVELLGWLADESSGAGDGCVDYVLVVLREGRVLG